MDPHPDTPTDQPPIALSIAGFDPSSGAGVTADLSVFGAHGVFGTSAVTALTVQSTTGVEEVQPVDAGLLRRTLDCLQEDLPPAGIKIGMLAGSSQVHAVADYIHSARRLKPDVCVVLDPVLRSSSGHALLDAEGIAVMVHRLLPEVDLLTPNTIELQILAEAGVDSVWDIERSARLLQLRAPRLRVLVTGGHREKPDDLLVEPGRVTLLEGTRIQTRATHGTGCALSSAFLANLICGCTYPEAAERAKAYVAEAMRHAVPRGHGHGPLNHLWTRPLRPISGQ